MKISHETPICLLERSLTFNDYQYCLVHLLDEQPEYLQHFENCRDNGVHVLLDNSIFELGTAFDSKKFSYWVERLRPNEYIIPDVLEDCMGTIENVLSWCLNEKTDKLPGKKIGVVQGKSYEEMVACYSVLDKFCDKIAFSFDYSWYQELYPHRNKLYSWSVGRMILIRRLLNDGVINTNKPHHLLGCSLPSEFSYYPKDWTWLESLDTSNPIVYGISEEVTNYGYKVKSKPSIKLFELINHKMTNKEIEEVAKNVEIFKDIVNSKNF